MNNKVEALLDQHIQRLEKVIAEREADNPFHVALTRVDAKNVASLREGRVPQYGDHIELLGDSSELANSGLDMFEFADLTEEISGVNPWPRDPAVS